MKLNPTISGGDVMEKEPTIPIISNFSILGNLPIIVLQPI
jgi:hypothetical protein